MSVIQRTSAVRRPSPLPTNTSSNAPTTGSNHETVSNGTFNQSPVGGSIRSRQSCLSPEVVAQYQNDADEQRPGIRAHRSALQPPQQRRTPVDDRRGSIDRAVDDVHVDAAPQPLLRHDADWLHDSRVVNFVDVVLVQQQAI